MRHLILIIGFVVSFGGYGVEKVPVLPSLKLVGVIVDQNSPLDKTILVIKDLRQMRTYTIRGKDIIPNSNFKLVQLGRNFILVSDGQKVFQVNQQEPQTRSAERYSEPSSVEDMDPDAIIARSNLAWERLEQKAKEKNLELFKDRLSKQVREEEVTEDENCEEDGCSDDPEEEGEEEHDQLIDTQGYDIIDES